MRLELKNVLFELMRSHARLSQAEYDRDPTFNSEHFAYKAEERLVNYLRVNAPEVLQEYLEGEIKNEKL